jgi:hypothetical protein
MTSPAGCETRCKTCGKKITFGRLGNGKLIPLDLVAPVYALLDGELATRAESYYVSHFATCPQASEHSKSKKPAGPSAADFLIWNGLSGEANEDAIREALRRIDEELKPYRGRVDPGKPTP